MDSSSCRIRETAEGLVVPLHVQARARCTELAGVHNGALKLKISAPPVDDAANRAVVEFFSELMGIPKSRIRIVSGLKSRDKVLRIAGASLRNLQALLP